MTFKELKPQIDQLVSEGKTHLLAATAIAEAHEITITDLVHSMSPMEAADFLKDAEPTRK